MSKAIVEFDVPENCRKCKIKYEYTEYGGGLNYKIKICVPTGERLDGLPNHNKTRPLFCPLKIVKDPKEESPLQMLLNKIKQFENSVESMGRPDEDRAAAFGFIASIKSYCEKHSEGIYYENE